MDFFPRPGPPGLAPFLVGCHHRLAHGAQIAWNVRDWAFCVGGFVTGHLEGIKSSLCSSLGGTKDMQSNSSLMITARDDDLLGVANRSDPLGVLAVWSTRARVLVPHLTEQTTEVRGFQVLIEAFRLWELYEPLYPEHAGRLDDFFLLIEQAFGRTVGWHDQDWPLPGARRVRARSGEKPRISLNDPDWHLLGGQKANGIWGLYRGAARRARLLLEDMTRLHADTMREATSHQGIDGSASNRLFPLVKRAMDGETVELPVHLGNILPKNIYETFRKVPLANHLQKMLIDAHGLNKKLAARLLAVNVLDHRTFLAAAALDLQGHLETIMDAIRCEDLLAPVEAVFLWLCACKGLTVEAAVADLTLDLASLETARVEFGSSGHYGSGTAFTRQARFHEQLDTSSHSALARSVLRLHEQVSQERKRAAWVWEDQGVLNGDIDIARPSDPELQVGLAWRNDYYLYPLKSIALQLDELLA